VEVKENRLVSSYLARTVLFFFVSWLALGCGGDSVAPPPSFQGQIEVRYVSSVPPTVDAAVKFAVDKWTRALHKNLGDFHLQSPPGQCFVGEPQLDEVHHNLLLFISVGQIDGSGNQLALTNVCRMSDHDLLPIVSNIRIDIEDVASMDANGKTRGVVLHEMAHALGFNPKSYLPKSLTAGGTMDPIFIGEKARGEFALHGAWYTGATVPLEDASGNGPQDPHWRYRVFGDELMVGGIATGFKSPLSSITLGLFQDIG
jgi:hypothetical protein